MANLLKLTNTKGETILIGVESIISVEEKTITDIKGNKIHCREISSRGAMVSKYYVIDTIDEIYSQYKTN